jgi:hypothetical protein
VEKVERKRVEQKQLRHRQNAGDVRRAQGRRVVVVVHGSLRLSLLKARRLHPDGAVHGRML